MSGKLKMLSAGAGAGKTYSLSNEIVESIQNGVAPENMMATTFTTKAAEELIERIRLMLLKSGDKGAAARILDGYVGTMNSVFGRLLREFALELGLSPVQKVLAETEVLSIFYEITSEVNQKFYLDYYQVFSRLGLDHKDHDWRKIVLKIIEQARQNNMTFEEVRDCANYSWDKMKAWLPKTVGEAEGLDQTLKSALVVAKSQLPGADKTKTTAVVLETIKGTLSEWDRNGFISWQQWAKLSKLKPAKKSAEVVSPILAAAGVHDRHPRLHEDLKDAIFAVFYCAAEAMELYQEEKSKRGLIDFTDQESLALGLLMDPQNEEALKDRISEVFVDEFQDSSPLQVALIMKLRDIAEKSTWVGDVKQAIYGFRGTDPELMQTAMANITDMDVKILDASWRSRESLVQFVNAIFVPVFEARGMAAERIALDPQRKDLKEQSLAIEVWSYSSSRNKKVDAAHIALGVEKVLADKEKYIVVDKTSRAPRPLKAGDIAILCRSNDDCTGIAEALAERGIAATVGESGLMATPEVIFAVAALRYLVDPQDTLALAELVHFSSEEDGEWLSGWLENKMVPKIPMLEKLDEVRDNITQMSPSEVLDVAIVTAKVDEIALSWGQGDQRLANLDALRKLASVYEENAETKRSTATTSGFILFLIDVEKDDDLNKVAQSTDEHAVQVLTYHKAKGLEWPFVILDSLDRSSKRTRSAPPVFNDVIPVSTEGFHVEDPLHGRRLYYWPWPYGGQVKNVGFDQHILDAPELERKELQLLEENQRLMYVGMTRARDYAAFTARDFSKIGWLDELKDAEGNRVLREIGVVDEGQEDMPLDNLGGKIVVNGKSFACKVRELSVDVESGDIAIEEEARETVFVGKVLDEANFKPARFSPSGLRDVETLDDDETDTTKIYRIGNRLPLTGQPDMAVLGEMVHAFLAVDDIDAEREERLKLAEDVRARYGIHALTSDAMLAASDRLAEFISEHYPDVISIQHEWPVHLRRELQKASGWIDLLLLTPEGYVIIDHKTFPGREAEWISQARTYLPQLQAYAEAISKATGRPVSEAWIHMPVVGAMVQLKGEESKVY